jgi:hypothetical protein
MEVRNIKKEIDNCYSHNWSDPVWHHINKKHTTCISVCRDCGCVLYGSLLLNSKETVQKGDGNA